MLHLTMGSGNSGKGGDAKVLAGATSAESGGLLTLRAGYGSRNTNGSVSLQTLGAGTSGVSGVRVMSSGAAAAVRC